MKRLYKIVIFFILIFLIGIYITVKSINSSFSSNENIQAVTYSTEVIQQVVEII